MSPIRLPAAIARLRDKARQSRRAAFKMQPSAARAAVERVALRWEIMAEAENRLIARLTPANEP